MLSYRTNDIGQLTSLKRKLVEVKKEVREIKRQIDVIESDDEK